MAQNGELERKHELLKKNVTEYILKENREGNLNQHDQMMKNRLTRELHYYAHNLK